MERCLPCFRPSDGSETYVVEVPSAEVDSGIDVCATRTWLFSVSVEIRGCLATSSSFCGLSGSEGSCGLSACGLTASPNSIAPGEVPPDWVWMFFAKIVRRSEYPRFRDRERPAESGLWGEVGERAFRGDREEVVLRSGDLPVEVCCAILVLIDSPRERRRSVRGCCCCCCCSLISSAVGRSRSVEKRTWC